jgi:hypothetical protein
MTFYVIGDSHVSVFSQQGTAEQPFMVPIIHHRELPMAVKHWKSVSKFVPIRLGAYTAYNIATKLQKIDNTLQILKCTKKDTILISVGEVDCRIHLTKQIELGRDMNEVVNECVVRYFESIQKLRIHTRLQIGIWAPACSLADNMVHHVERVWYHGDEIMRNKVVHLFNTLLSELCAANGVPFLNISADTIDMDTFRTKVYYQQDSLHLSQTAMPFIMSKLKNMMGGI